MIREYQEKDCKDIASIYNFYIENTHHTFETKSISDEEMKERIKGISRIYPFLVYEEDKKILGYAYASRWKVRQAYDHTVESSVYLKKASFGKGIGTKLSLALIDELRKTDIHCVLAGISLPNPASISLHEKLGYKKSGVLREVGYKFEKWIDVGYWQLTL